MKTYCLRGAERLEMVRGTILAMEPDGALAKAGCGDLLKLSLQIPEFI
ncbi:hypothetical protein [Robertkochia marina]|nr:hypothetical protein [Robertkochia marina]